MFVGKIRGEKHQRDKSQSIQGNDITFNQKS